MSQINDISKLTVPKLKALMKRENISIPEPTKDKRILKADLVKTIRDHRAKHAPEKKIKITVKKSPQVDDINKLTVPKLKALMKKEGVPLPSPVKGRILKAHLVKAIRDHRSKKSPEEEIVISSKKTSPKKKKKPSPKKKKRSPKKKPSPKKKKRSPKKMGKCGDKSNKCLPKACDFETGECKARTKAGKLYKPVETQMKKKYGDDFYYDEKHGLIGRKEDVLEQIASWKGPKKEEEEVEEEEKVTKKATKKATKKCNDKEDYLECPKDTLCNAKSGRCISNTIANLQKNKYILRIDGRELIGDKETIDQAQKLLGGSVSETAELIKKPSPKKKKTPSPKKKKTPSPKKKTPSPKKKKSPSPKKRSPLKKEKLVVSEKEEEVKIMATKDEIAETFAKCIAKLTNK